jgi:hypothetical protein
MAMTTDKVLALAREAGLAVTISSYDSLYKFAALVEAVQKEHGGDITNPKCPICIAINALNEKPIDPNKWAFDRGLESY